PEAEVMALDLHPASEPQSEMAPAAHRPDDDLFASATLVASRGLLPQEWVNEIAIDRRDPRLLFETFLEDVRYACRLILRNPLLSAVIVLTLTVGIGSNASVFTVVNGLALRPHVYKDPASFMRIVPTSRLQGKVRQVSYGEYIAREKGATFVIYRIVPSRA